MPGGSKIRDEFKDRVVDKYRDYVVTHVPKGGKERSGQAR